MKHREKTREYREKNIRNIWDMMGDFVTIVKGVPERGETRNVSGDIFEETLARNLPRRKTLSHRIKKLYKSEAR